MSNFDKTFIVKMQFTTSEVEEYDCLQFLVIVMGSLWIINIF